MKKIQYTKINKKDVFVYFDKSIFISEEHEKKCLAEILERIIGVYLFEGSVILDCKDENVINSFKKYALRYEESIHKSFFYQSATIKIIFSLDTFQEILDLLYQSGTTFDGKGMRRDGSKIGLVLNDHDGSCIILSEDSKKLEYYKNQFLKEINK